LTARLVREPKTGPTTCRQCGVSITWAITDKGKRMPVDTVPVQWGTFVLGHKDGVHRVTHFSTLERGGKTYAGPLWLAHWASARHSQRVPQKRRPPPAQQLGFWVPKENR